MVRRSAPAEPRQYTWLPGDYRRPDSLQKGDSEGAPSRARGGTHPHLRLRPVTKKDQA